MAGPSKLIPLRHKPKILSTVLWLSIHWEVLRWLASLTWSGHEREPPPGNSEAQRHLDNKPRFFAQKNVGNLSPGHSCLDTLGIKLWGNSIYQDKGRHASISLIYPIPWSSQLLTVKMRDLKLRSGNMVHSTHTSQSNLHSSEAPFYWASELFGRRTVIISFSVGFCTQNIHVNIDARNPGVPQSPPLDANLTVSGSSLITSGAAQWGSL